MKESGSFLGPTGTISFLKLVEYQKSLVFPRVLKAKNEGQGKSSDSSPSRGASPDIASLIRTEDYASFTNTSREKIRIDWEKI